MENMTENPPISNANKRQKKNIKFRKDKKKIFLLRRDNYNWLRIVSVNIGTINGHKNIMKSVGTILRYTIFDKIRLRRLQQQKLFQ